MAKRLTKDLESIQKNYKDTFNVELPSNDLKLWHVSFQGAAGTIYDNEKFKFISKNKPILIINVLILDCNSNSLPIT